MNFKSLTQLLDHFKDEKTCVKYYEQLRWNGNVTCPHCQSEKPYVTDRGYKCSNNKCYKKFTVKVGTIFENSKIEFRIWLAAIFLCTTAKKGVSSLQLASQLGITQKTAWFVLHRVREMLKQQAPDMVGGNGTMVESDETYIGGKESNKHANKKTKPDENGVIKEKKRIVVGIIERDGKVILKHIPNASQKHMVAFIRKHVPEGATIFTDEHKAYQNLGKVYTHDTVNHGFKIYVAGNVHTNSIENFWSVLKRGIYGIYHSVSDKHLDRYLCEFAGRFNERKATNQERVEKFLAKSDVRLTYDNLIAKK